LLVMWATKALDEQLDVWDTEAHNARHGSGVR